MGWKMDSSPLEYRERCRRVVGSVSGNLQPGLKAMKCERVTKVEVAGCQREAVFPGELFKISLGISKAQKAERASL